MRNFFFPLLIFVVAITAKKSFAQEQMDTITFLNGEVQAVKVIDTAFNTIKYLPKKKNEKSKAKIFDVEKDGIFSVKYSNGEVRFVYFFDSIIGNVFTVLEAKNFILGEQEATKNFRCRWPFVVGFIAGVASPIALSNAVVLSPIPAMASTPVVFIPKVRINTKKITDKNYLQYDTYLMGYERVARKKMFINAVIGAGAGLAVGFGLWALTK